MERKLYPHSGFLSNDETREQRVQRLFEAYEQGYIIAPNDYRYMKTNGRFNDFRFRIGEANNGIKAQTRRDERAMVAALSAGPPPFRG